MLFPFVLRAGCALLIAGSLAAPVFAQTAQPTPEHLALARAVLDFTGAGTSFDGVVPKLLEDARVEEGADCCEDGVCEDLGCGAAGRGGGGGGDGEGCFDVVLDLGSHCAEGVEGYEEDEGE